MLEAHRNQIGKPGDKIGKVKKWFFIDFFPDFFWITDFEAKIESREA